MQMTLRSLGYAVVAACTVAAAGCGPPSGSDPQETAVSAAPATVHAYMAVIEDGRVTVRHEMVTVEQARWVRETRRANRAGGVSGGPVQQALIASSASWSDCSNFTWTYFEGSGSFYCIKHVSGWDTTGVALPFTPTYIDGSTSHNSAVCNASSSCWVGDACQGSNVIRHIGIGEWIPSYSGGGTWAWIGPLILC
jgi:hypothetical protein